jgi:hypothetical protein
VLGHRVEYSPGEFLCRRVFLFQTLQAASLRYGRQNVCATEACATKVLGGITQGCEGMQEFRSSHASYVAVPGTATLREIFRSLRLIRYNRRGAIHDRAHHINADGKPA